MSLLLEALKKAELAKQSADTSPAGESAPSIDPVITRDTLPDISQPLEIRANDLPSAAPQASGLQFDPVPVPLSQTDIDQNDTLKTPSPFNTSYSAEPPAVAQEPVGAEDNQRAAARQMFEAKEVDYNPKRPFYITLGVLGLFAAGYGGYVWWQLQPRNVYSAAAAAKKAGETPPNAPPPPAQVTPAGAPAQAAAATAPATQAPPAAITAAAPTQTPSPAIAPGTPATAPDRKTPAAPAVPGMQAQSAQAAAKPAARRATTAGTTRSQEQGSAAPIAVNPPALVVDPQIERAYEAFQQGDLATARSQYQSALQRDPSNRDVLLGLAAIDMRTRNYDLAESRYLKLLEADPRDALAMAGLIALRGQTNPLQSESRLKTLIAAHPDSAHLHFALGNQYAVLVRWPDAQAAYFKAYTLDPDNPDFAFNLAVSLDQMRQTKLALEYYRRALALASTRSTGFDRNQVSARITELSR